MKSKREESGGLNHGVKKVKNAGQALAALMRYASKAERSSGDAVRLMRGWGVPGEDIPGVLARLVEMKFIDDKRFAQAYVRDKSLFAGWGIHKIMAGLRSKGVPAVISEDAVAQYAGNGTLNVRLHELLGRKLKCIGGGTEYEIKGKLVRFGLSRGYEYEAVLDAAAKVMGLAGRDYEGDVL